MATPLLEVEDLRTWFSTSSGTAKAVDGVSFTLNAGETLAIVGESGSGKSITALSLMQLVPEPAGYIESGRILYGGKDLLDLTWEQMRGLRGKDLAMIFQEPMTSLNPVMTVGWQIREAMEVHGKYRGDVARQRTISLLDQVGIRAPQQIVKQYPYELSGGMRQRVMIAMALSNDPKILLADEPTTALDVTVQAQILDLLATLQKQLGMTMLLITHDLGIVSRVAHRVAVMYGGQIVEQAETRQLLTNPQHPYTQGLIASLPTRSRRGEDLYTMEGVVPAPTAWPVGCRFAARCPKMWNLCEKAMPQMYSADDGRPVRCHLYSPIQQEPATNPEEMAS